MLRDWAIMRDTLIGLAWLYVLLDIVAVIGALLFLWAYTDEHDANYARRRRQAALYTMFIFFTGPVTLICVVLIALYKALSGLMYLWNTSDLCRRKPA